MKNKKMRQYLFFLTMNSFLMLMNLGIGFGSPTVSAACQNVNPMHIGTVYESINYQINFPVDMVITEDGCKGYVSNRQNACIVVINLCDGDPVTVGQIDIPGFGTPKPTQMTINKSLKELYAIDYEQAKLFIVDTETDVLDPTEIDVGSYPTNILLSPDETEIYVCSNDDAVTVISAASRTVSDTILLNEDVDPTAMAIANNKLYVIGDVTAKAHIVDLNPESTTFHGILKKISAGGSPVEAVASPDGSTVYVVNNTMDGGVTVIDTESDTSGGMIPVKTPGESDAKNPIDLTIIENILFVINYSDDSVTAICLDTNEIISTNHPTGSNGPTTLTPSPDGGTLYIVHEFPKTVEIMDVGWIEQFRLDIGFSGNCAGKVRDATAGIDCESDCAIFVDQDTLLTLLATPVDVNCSFTGWLDEKCSGAGACDITMTEDVSVTADFRTSYQLDVSKQGTGAGVVTSDPPGITCGNDCSAVFVDGSEIILTATADAGSMFVEWSGGPCAEFGTNPCTVQINDYTSVTAFFNKRPILAVTKSGECSGKIVSNPAGIDCGEDCDEAYDQLTEVTLEVIPDDKCDFVGWTGDCAGQNCTLTMTSAKSVNANFAPLYELNVESTGKGAGTVVSDIQGVDCGDDCSELYRQDTDVTLTAAASTGYRFIGWIGGGCGESETCSVTMTSDISLKAEFELKAGYASKAIIVAGGGPEIQGDINHIWDRTKVCSNYAYMALTHQGYTDDMIYYMSADEDEIGDNIDAYATLAHFEWAVNSWAEGADRLLVYLADHGIKDIFQINSTEQLSSQELSRIMNEWSKAMPACDYQECKCNQVIIYEACHSGTFLNDLIPPETFERVVITSAGDEDAVLGVEGRHSFSYQFWASVLEGAYLDDAFFFAQEMVKDSQTAQVDANGNGIGNEKNDRLQIDKCVIGTGKDTERPHIESVSPVQFLSVGDTGVIRAYNVQSLNEITDVWATIVPPCYSFEPQSQPITNLPAIRLYDYNTDGAYEQFYEDFINEGAYRITITAMDSIGRISIPKQTFVIAGDKLKLAVEAIQTLSQNDAGCFLDINGDQKTDMSDVFILLRQMSKE